MARSKYSQWYTLPRWRERRASQLRKEPLCKFCQQGGRVAEATIADHVSPHRGDQAAFWYGALQSLCGTCHSSVKQRMEAGQHVVVIGADGYPIDLDGSIFSSKR